MSYYALLCPFSRVYPVTETAAWPASWPGDLSPTWYSSFGNGRQAEISRFHEQAPSSMQKRGGAYLQGSMVHENLFFAATSALTVSLTYPYIAIGYTIL